MHTLRRIPHGLLALVALTLAALVAVPARAAGVVEVRFIAPEKYVDIGRLAFDRDKVLRQLRTHFEELGRRLPDGQTLKVDVLEIDLAGTLWPTRNGEELRVLRGGADWPRLTLNYVLAAPGEASKSGAATLSDMAYMQRQRLPDTRDLAFERRMIDEWFETVILSQAAVK